MRNFLAIFIAIVSITASVHYSFTWFVFKLNQSYIAQNLCVEKDIENNTCQGCCHLNKEMQKQGEQEGSSDTGRQKVTFDLISCYLSHSGNTGLKANAISYIDIQRLNYSSFYTDIFHPPKI